ncbi:MAG: aminotransferase class V-fold PLP-dependent enzyme [Phenylobacterium sp.]|uniref:aminotransferase class V-fold PLP-dependent enzyme n=1 Tax=Phenylobacterium sp. TaxID=1871053 RepID=UPI002736EFB2|nr:aminotransferase class V-fold PLP-dependent enzyme [Phenylobacterium sp.]MDP3117539.1 aminotransferase class V-fold PLP-dependent enzyme [Phenylobacterium sp.]
MTKLTRRGVVAAGLALGAGSQALAAASPAGGIVMAADETYWAGIAAQYDLADDVIQLENGNWGIMARPVLAAYERHQAMVNRRNSYYSRRDYGGDLARIRARVAANLGVEPDEIAFTRGATEALQALIGGYNRLRAGDQVLIADLDYDSMQSAMAWLKDRRGADLIRVSLPEPATEAGLVEAYAQALEAHPRVRLMLLTQVSHRNGLHLPVAQITALARARNVDVILDSAHAWGQVGTNLRDLGADFVGLNGHKWIGAPIGVGVLYIAKARIPDIDPFMGADDYAAGDVRLRVHTGTANMAAYLAMEDALNFHEAIGTSAKAARLTYLRRRWTEPLRGVPGVQILTPDDDRLGSALGAFRLTGRMTPAENADLARALLERFGIFTVARHGLASGSCVRATVSLFTRPAEVDRLAQALLELGGA